MRFSPKEVRIENSTICNYKCEYCPISTEKFERKKEIMDNKLFVSIVDKIKRLKSIKECCISGFGEAFLDKNILFKIDYIVRNGYKTYTITNGTMSKDQFKDLCEIGIEDVRVSIKNENCLDLVDDIISINGDKVILTMIYNEVDHNEVIKKYKNHVKNLEVWKPHNWVSTYNYRSGDTILNSCNRPFNGPLQIQVDGTINMCCFDYNGHLLIGDLKNSEIDEVFENSITYKKLVNGHLTGCLDDFICSDCDQRKSKKGILVYSKMYKESRRVNLTSTGYNDYRNSRCS